MRYTLDSIEDGYYNFTKRPTEDFGLRLPVTVTDEKLAEGDFVTIEENGDRYEITRCTEETTNRRKDVEDLLNKLQNK